MDARSVGLFTRLADDRCRSDKTIYGRALARGSRPETKRAIAGALVEARAPAGATLLEQGQPNDHLTFLIEGTAEIVRTFGTGRREVITQLTAPAVFGTTSFFQPKPPTVTVRATSDVWMLSLYHPAHEALRAANPRAAEALALAVVRALSERFDLIDKLFTEFTAQAFRRAGEKERMGGVSRPLVRGAWHLGRRARWRSSSATRPASERL